ncbi:hypothetical protein [Amycolatopsis azurea]|uniref:Uncharacterized protein n=1 Tax=Amycolatopsis azurea DSM 43854 TaxID=1238180 RepID=M2PTQ5_9PSEU|nr:hypothetical protein [Amycolatopsis azurea]EMD22900.1 hypothetical protein C791_7900 [Amycolatopsis azurea DSM 43854]OOC04266.1 hypothetical protein B0293_23705 [Amycolatopsis azurea DSM 43854]
MADQDDRAHVVDTAAVFLRAAAADSLEAADVVVREYLGEGDPIDRYGKLWALISIGLVVVGETLRALMNPPGPVTLEAEVAPDPVEITAMQAITAQVNLDPEAAQDVVTGHVAAEGLDGLVALLPVLLDVYRLNAIWGTETAS